VSVPLDLTLDGTSPAIFASLVAVGAPALDVLVELVLLLLELPHAASATTSATVAAQPAARFRILLNIRDSPSNVRMGPRE
jgi:hypothetical protein